MARFDSARPGGRRQLVPLLLVAFAVIFNLVVLRPELRPASHLNDNALHVQMVKWAEQEIEAGRAPMDGWYPALGVGSPHFRQYHSTAHQLTGLAARATRADRALRITLYLLLALWPLSVFWGARLLGWGRWAAGAAALVSPLVISTPGYGFEHASYVWRGYGLWSQLWAMWTLPIALGLGWRAVSRGRSYAVAALALAGTIAFHMMAGYLALLALGVWTLLRRGELIRRVGRAALLGIGTLGVAAWVLVPLLTDARWMNSSSYARGTFWIDSFGARRVLGWLVSGQLFDAGRFPIISILAAIGFAVCLAKFRTVEPARALIGFFALSLVLFFGRPTLGPILNLLPGGADLQMHRFIFGVHMAGIILAGAGVAWLGTGLTWVVQRISRRRLPAAVVGLAAVAALVPAWGQISAYHSEGAGWIEAQRSADRSPEGADVVSLIDSAKRRGDGRVYAGMRSGWGRSYKVGTVPVYSLLMEQGADAVGYTLRVASLSTDFEALFDDTNPAHYDLFNVRYLILPKDQPPPVASATVLEERGKHRLWTVQTTGYAKLVDTTKAVSADRTNLVDHLGWFLRSSELQRGVHPVVAFAGARPAAPTMSSPESSRGSPGEITGLARSGPGTYAISVVAERPSAVMLKASFDPGWEAFVDGRPVATQMLAPSFVGVPVPAGNHVVVFRYKRFAAYPLLFIVAAGSLLGLARLSRGDGKKRRHLPPALADERRDDGELALSVIVPAFNEEGRIADTLRRICEVLPDEAELIVVDDGSADRTPEIAAGFGPRVRTLRLHTNRGKGAAVRHGVAASRGRAVVFMDADLATDLEALPRVLAGLAEADVVIGSRGMQDSVVTDDSAMRSRLGQTFAQLQRMIMRMQIADSQCGFKGFRGGVARQLFSLGTVDGFAFDAEILLLARRLAYEIREVAVLWRAGSGSKVRTVRDSIAMLRDLVVIRLRWPSVASSDAGHHLGGPGPAERRRLEPSVQGAGTS